MPKLSDTMTEGTVIKWHKQVGDSVEVGDLLAEIETDKATMEMEAFDDGKITEILVAEGQKAAIGGILAVLDGDSAAAPAVSSPATPTAPNSAPAPSKAKAPAAHAANDGDRIKASPLARKIAEEKGVDLQGISGLGVKKLEAYGQEVLRICRS